jgi:hypothetical protein
MFAEPVAVPAVAAASVRDGRPDRLRERVRCVESVVTNSRVSAVPFAGHTLVGGLIERAATTVPESFTNVRSMAEIVAAAPPASAVEDRPIGIAAGRGARRSRKSN